MKRKGYKTLAEHDAELKASGKWDEYAARKEARDRTLEQVDRECAAAEAPLVAQ